MHSWVLWLGQQRANVGNQINFCRRRADDVMLSGYGFWLESQVPNFETNKVRFVSLSPINAFMIRIKHIYCSCSEFLPAE